MKWFISKSPEHLPLTSRQVLPGRFENSEIVAEGSTEPTTMKLELLVHSTSVLWVIPSLPAAITNTELAAVSATNGSLSTPFQPGCSVQPDTPSDMLMMLAPCEATERMPSRMSLQPAVSVESNGL